jgi:predicted dinucleotide-binding enzyme
MTSDAQNAIAKAFNNISTSDLTNWSTKSSPQTVRVTGNFRDAEAAVTSLAWRMDHLIVDYGGISNATIQEQTAHRLLDGWVESIIFIVSVERIVTVYFVNL